jgi:hypothetical protein
MLLPDLDREYTYQTLQVQYPDWLAKPRLNRASIPRRMSNRHASGQHQTSFVVAGLGIEPRFQAPKARVLPLDDPAILSRPVKLHLFPFSDNVEYCELERQFADRRDADIIERSEEIPEELGIDDCFFIY